MRNHRITRAGAAAAEVAIARAGSPTFRWPAGQQRVRRLCSRSSTLGRCGKAARIEAADSERAEARSAAAGTRKAAAVMWCIKSVSQAYLFAASGRHRRTALRQHRRRALLLLCASPRASRRWLAALSTGSAGHGHVLSSFLSMRQQHVPQLSTRSSLVAARRA